MNVIEHLAECSDCGRKILVFLMSIGTPHQFVNSVICGECLVKKGIDKQWAEEHPDRAKGLEAWLLEVKE